jgi:CDP-diacylglycerol--serine O-phosphatidyltransferase
MSPLKHIPNALTSMNLLCGCIGIVFCFTGHITGAGWLVLCAAAFDFADGFAARALHAHSAIGKDLDSLADVVTFGVLPSLIMMQLFITVNPLLHINASTPFPEFLLPWIPLLLAVFSALRLAKFNNDSRQKESFIGLPTPANALAIAAFPNLIQNYLVKSGTENLNIMELGAFNLFSHPVAYVAYILLMCWLLIAELPLFALKFKNFSWADNRYSYILLLCSLLLLFTFKIGALPLIVFLYVTLSLIKHISNFKKLT